MSDPQLVQRIEAALGTVMEPELHRDLMSLNMVRDLRVDDGTVSMRVVLTTPACPLKDRIHRDIEQALIPINGVERVAVSWDSNVTSTRGLPGRKDIPGVRNIVAVSAGKGGVGKTTVSVNVAIALSQAGARVGLLDADIYGPNVPIMLGLHDQPRSMGERILPPESHGLKVMSLGLILKPDQAVVWRGPMLGGAIRQFLYDVEWGELDYLVIDLPPGTGDAQLTLAQAIPLTGAVIVTTPQDVSVADVSRGVQMFRQLKVPVLGVVENMSGYVCPHCGESTELFGSGGGHQVAERYEIAYLGEIPLDPRIRIGGGEGMPLMASMPDSPVAEVFRGVASHVAAEVSKENYRVGATGPVMPSGPRIQLS
ncbi:MAG TPA: Mrp/NBP35 family ATP-binding protein [Candidatus Dormibacteraeota bacterium]|jgi:ATP-binding protein involved in chromosome partitioning|nr:Mrp/NBP35 family ATP-binding protein [Candidatus Dormibacteraeota bacterium]